MSSQGPSESSPLLSESTAAAAAASTSSPTESSSPTPPLTPLGSPTTNGDGCDVPACHSSNTLNTLGTSNYHDDCDNGDGSEHACDDVESGFGLIRKNSFTSLRYMSERIHRAISHHTGSIGYLGSMAIAVNSLTGPAMLNLPALYARSGIIPTTATILFVCLLSAMGCLHMSSAISKVDRDSNHDFKKEVEFSEAYRSFWGREWFIITQVLFFCCITCLNISSIVDTSQVVDTFLGHWMWGVGGTAALQVRLWGGDGSDDDALHWVRWDAHSDCSQEDLQSGLCLPFREILEDAGGDDVDSVKILITAGNVITTLVYLPLSLMDLKENASGQIVGFIILLVTSAFFIVQFSVTHAQNMSAAGNADGTAEDHLVSLTSSETWWGYDWSDLFGVVLFNFALVLAVPSWLYEREPHVDVPTVVHGSIGLSAFLYVFVGILGYLALPNVSENMLESMMSGVLGVPVQFMASAFAFFIIGLGIPLFSVLTRLNLTGSGLCTRPVGNVLAVYLPFAVSWLLNGGNSITKLLSWGGMIFTGLVAFILPLVLAIHVVRDYPHYVGSIDVYFGRITKQHHQLYALYILLFFTVCSILLAMVGNIVG